MMGAQPVMPWEAVIAVGVRQLQKLSADSVGVAPISLRGRRNDR